MSRPAFESLSVGTEVAAAEYPLTRDTLVRYAGASGDFNPIHYNDVFAQSVGLDGVIAHGMLTMGTAVNVVVDFIGDPGRVKEYGVRFTKPVAVPNPGEATLNIAAKVGKLDDAARTARIDLTVSVDGAKVLGKAQATVDFA